MEESQIFYDHNSLLLGGWEKKGKKSIFMRGRLVHSCNSATKLQVENRGKLLSSVAVFIV